jgi:hypothetical protein
LGEAGGSEVERLSGMEKEVFVGIDVAKAHLDVAFNDGADCRRYTADDAGISKLVEHLKSRQVALVVLEAISDKR